MSYEQREPKTKATTTHTLVVGAVWMVMKDFYRQPVFCELTWEFPSSKEDVGFWRIHNGLGASVVTVAIYYQSFYFLRLIVGSWRELVSCCGRGELLSARSSLVYWLTDKTRNVTPRLISRLLWIEPVAWLIDRSHAMFTANDWISLPLVDRFSIIMKYETHSQAPNKNHQKTHYANTL